MREGLAVEDFVYTTVPGKIGALLSKISEVGVPQRATGKWLQSIGLTSSNDRSLLRVLEHLGFTDSSGSPGELWREYRGSEGKQALGSAIRRAYTQLYDTYPEAHTRSREELRAFFSSHSKAGKGAINYMVSTFLELCKVAGMNSERRIEVPIAGANGQGPNDKPACETISGMLPRGFAVNVNIQLTLPETTDEKVYDTFFSAMRRHLLMGDV